MNNMFNSSSKPFYQSEVCMDLKPIPAGIYVDFAVRMFQDYGKDVDPELVEDIYDSFDGCTWFVQMMMNELFALTQSGKSCYKDKKDIALENIIDVQAESYMDILSRLAPKQKMVLQAIAKEGRVTGITSTEFVRKYNLNSASSVQSAVKSLIKNDIVTV